MGRVSIQDRKNTRRCFTNPHQSKLVLFVPRSPLHTQFQKSNARTKYRCRVAPSSQNRVSTGPRVNRACLFFCEQRSLARNDVPSGSRLVLNHNLNDFVVGSIEEFECLHRLKSKVSEQPSSPDFGRLRYISQRQQVD